MGLFSDYLEELRSRSAVGDLDPCMIISSNIRNKFKSYYEIRRTLEDYSNNKVYEEKCRLKKSLIEQSSELEAIKIGYLLGEKIVLSIWNRGNLRSDLMIDTVQLLLSELQKSYHAICDLRLEINKRLGETAAVQFEVPSEKAIRKNMLNLIGSSIVSYLKDDSVILDTSTFRKVVFDFAEIIRCFKREQYNQPDKKVVHYHLEKEFHLNLGQHRCGNCGSVLLKDIPYCLNCYERN